MIYLNSSPGTRREPLPSYRLSCAVSHPQEPCATPSSAPHAGAMHCEVAEAHSEKRPKEAPDAPGPGCGPTGLGAHMAFRVTVSGGGCGDGDPRDLLSRPLVPPPRAHDLLRSRSPRNYGPSKVAAAGKGKSGPANTRGQGCGGVLRDSDCLASPLHAFVGILGRTWCSELSPEVISFSLVVWD